MRRKRDLRALEQRQLAAAKLLEKGVPQAEVARRLGVSRQSVSDRAKKFERKGKNGLKGGAFGQSRQLRDRLKLTLVRLRVARPVVVSN